MRCLNELRRVWVGWGEYLFLYLNLPADIEAIFRRVTPPPIESTWPCYPHPRGGKNALPPYPGMYIQIRLNDLSIFSVTTRLGSWRDGLSQVLGES